MKQRKRPKIACCASRLRTPPLPPPRPKPRNSQHHLPPPARHRSIPELAWQARRKRPRIAPRPPKNPRAMPATRLVPHRRRLLFVRPIRLERRRRPLAEPIHLVRRRQRPLRRPLRCRRLRKIHLARQTLVPRLGRHLPPQRTRRRCLRRRKRQRWIHSVLLRLRQRPTLHLRQRPTLHLLLRLTLRRCRRRRIRLAMIRSQPQPTPRTMPRPMPKPANRRRPAARRRGCLARCSTPLVALCPARRALPL
jgi:hypothetical protein